MFFVSSKNSLGVLSDDPKWEPPKIPIKHDQTWKCFCFRWENHRTSPGFFCCPKSVTTSPGVSEKMLDPPRNHGFQHVSMLKWINDLDENWASLQIFGAPHSPRLATLRATLARPLGLLDVPWGTPKNQRCFSGGHLPMKKVILNQKNCETQRTSSSSNIKKPRPIPKKKHQENINMRKFRRASRNDFKQGAVASHATLHKAPAAAPRSSSTSSSSSSRGSARPSWARNAGQRARFRTHRSAARCVLVHGRVRQRVTKGGNLPRLRMGLGVGVEILEV